MFSHFSPGTFWHSHFKLWFNNWRKKNVLLIVVNFFSLHQFSSSGLLNFGIAISVCVRRNSGTTFIQLILKYYYFSLNSFVPSFFHRFQQFAYIIEQVGGKNGQIKAWRMICMSVHLFIISYSRFTLHKSPNNAKVITKRTRILQVRSFVFTYKLMSV